MQLGGYLDEPEVVELHRAIGAFTTTFSEMLANMRRATIAYFEEDDYPVRGDRARLFDSIYATMTAKPISDSFFASSRVVAHFDAADEAILKTIRKTVSEQVEFRNDIAHADWSVGWQTHPEGEKLPPSAHKVRSVSGIPTHKNLGITMELFTERIHLQAALPGTIFEVGRVAKARQRDEDVSLADRLQLFQLPSSGVRLYRARRSS